jgi:hypothetical protein
VVVVLMSALRHGANRARLKQLRDFLGISERTLERWRRWWLRDFAESDFWKLLKAKFAVPVEQGCLPASVLERFEGDERSRLVATLRSLAPITGGQGLADHLAWWSLEIRKR